MILWFALPWVGDKKMAGSVLFSTLLEKHISHFCVKQEGNWSRAVKDAQAVGELCTQALCS